MKKAYIILFVLSLVSAQAAQVLVNGTNYTGPLTGVTASTMTTTETNSAVRVLANGTLAGANGWTITALGNGALGISVRAASPGATAYTVFSGSHLNITTSGSAGYGVRAFDKGSSITLVSSTITTSGISAHGLFANNNVGLSDPSTLLVEINGNGLHVETRGQGASAVFARNSYSFITLASSTIVTLGNAAHGLHVETGTTAGMISGSGLRVTTNGVGSYGIYLNNGPVNVTDSMFFINDPTTAMIDAVGGGNNTATLTRVTASIKSGILYTTSSPANSINTLNINESILMGDLLVNNTGTTRNTVNLSSSSMLIGMSAKTPLAVLTMNITDGSRWIVTAPSAVTNMNNSAMLDLRTEGARLTAVNFAQTSGGNTLIALNAGGPFGPFVTVDNTATFAGLLDLTLDSPSMAVGETFTLFQWDNRVDTFEAMTLNGLDIWQSGESWDFTTSTGIDGTVTYGTDILTLAITGFTPTPSQMIAVSSLANWGLANMNLHAQFGNAILANAFVPANPLPVAGKDCKTVIAQTRTPVFWCGYFGGFENMSLQKHASGYNVNSHGAFLGVTQPLDDHWNIGGFLGYTRSNFDWRGVRGDGFSNGYHGGAFASWQGEIGLRSIASGAYSYFEGDMRRAGSKSSPREHVGSIGVDLFYDLKNVCPFGGTPSPFAGFRQIWMHQNALREHGGYMPLRTDRITASQQRLTLGLNYAWEIGTACRVTWKPSLNAGWLHIFGDRETGTAGAFLGSGIPFIVRSVAVQRDALQVGAGLDIQWGSPWSATFNYTAELRTRNTTQAVFAGIKWQF